GELDGGLQLRVPPGRPVVGGVQHLDVRVDAVVLHVPAVVGERECVPGHGDAGAVDQFLVAVDADHAAPGAGADDRAEAGEADGGGDDGAGGPGDLGRRGARGAAARPGGVGRRAAPAPGAQGDAPAGQLLHHELGDVPAVVPAHVEDQPVAA